VKSTSREDPHYVLSSVLCYFIYDTERLKEYANTYTDLQERSVNHLTTINIIVTTVYSTMIRPSWISFKHHPSTSNSMEYL